MAARTSIRHSSFITVPTAPVPGHDQASDSEDVLVGHLRMHRQAQDLAARLLRMSQSADADENSAVVCRLEVNRDRVVDEGADVPSRQKCFQLVTAPAPYDILVVDVHRPGSDLRQHQVCLLEILGVQPGQLATSCVLCREVWKFRVENSGVQLVEPCVHTGCLTHVPFAPTILATAPPSPKAPRFFVG